MKKVLIAFITVFICLSDVYPEKIKAPEFDLFDFDNQIYRLSRCRDNIIVLNFFATCCPPCKKDIPVFVKTYKRYRNKKVMIIGILHDRNLTKKAIRKFIKDNKINYPVLQGTKNVIMDYGGIRAIPTTFIIDDKGYIIKKHIGCLSEKELIEIIRKNIDIRNAKKNSKKEGDKDAK